MAVPIRQLLSQTSYDTDGATTVWNFSFAGGYLDQADVKAYLLDKITGVRTEITLVPANFIGPNQLELTPAYAVGSELTIYRDTLNEGLPLVNFADKAALTESSLDLNAQQAIFVAAESADNVAVSIEAVSEIANQVAAAEGFADDAEASAVAAAGSASTADGHRIAAAASAAAALVSENNADASEAATAAMLASIADGPVVSVADQTGIVTAAQLRTGLGFGSMGTSLTQAADAAAVRVLLAIASQPTYRNLFFNGGMDCNILQQAAATTHGLYFVDGIRTDNTSVARLTTQQSTANPAPGYPFSLLSTVTTAGAPGAADFHIHSIPIEGTFIRKLGWGAAGASSIVVQFSVRCSITGTFALAVRNGTAARSYVTTFTVNSANTEEVKTIVIPGDTSGTWATGASIGMNVSIGMAVGTTYQTGTLGAWQAGNLIGATGQTQLTSTNGATFKITALDISPGTVAVAPEILPLDLVIPRAQRYFENSLPYGAALGSATPTGQIRFYAVSTSSAVSANGRYRVPKMVAPAGTQLNSPGTGAASNVRSTSTGLDVAINGVTATSEDINQISSGGLFTAGQWYEAQYIVNSRL